MHVSIRGERFDLKFEDDTVIVSHPHWSLVGVGRDLGEATRDLMVEASDVLAIFADRPLSQLSEATQRMVRFANSLLTLGA